MRKEIRSIVVGPPVRRWKVIGLAPGITHEVLPCRVLYHYDITSLCCEVARRLPLHWKGRNASFRGVCYDILLLLGGVIDDGKGSARVVC